MHGEQGRLAWSRVNLVVTQDFGGVWVSEGKLSRWQIPVKHGMANLHSPSKRALIIKDALEYAETVHKQSGILVEKLKELQQ